jgi:MFS family permease
MEKEPPHFECLNDSDGTWNDCSKEEICENNLPKDHYRPVTTDDEYFDNWVEKYDLLCEPSFKVGLIGSMYFIGVVVGMTFVGYLADLYGRKVPYISALVIQCLATLGLMVTNNLYEAYFYEFLLGLTFAGRCVVGLTYILEFNLPRYYDTIVFLLLVSENGNTILMTAWFQFVDRGWFLL